MTMNDQTPITARTRSHTFKFQLKKELSSTDVEVIEVERSDNAVSFAIQLNSEYINTTEWQPTQALLDLIREVYYSTRGSKLTTLNWVSDKHFSIVAEPVEA